MRHFTIMKMQRSKQKHLEEIASLLLWIATIDAFQHWIYTNPNHTHEQREEFWLKLLRDSEE